MGMRSPTSELDSLVREELARILASQEFSNSPYIQDFLRYIVDATLEGNSQHLKESVIGVHVFQRPIGYDPKLDPAVRMGAQRLRRKLLAYYAAHPGQGLQIVLSKGSYVPQFVPVVTSVADAATEDPALDAEEEIDSSQSEAAPAVPAAPAPRRPVSVWPARKRLLPGFLIAGTITVFWLSRMTGLVTPFGTRVEFNRVTPFTSLPFDEYNATFSPDGSEVAFSWAGLKEGNLDIYIQRVDESSAHRLTTDPGRDEFATWSPDGRWIAFRRNLNQVMLVSPLSGRERSLGSAAGEYLAWVPDGSALLVPKAHPGTDDYDLESIDISTGERRDFALDGQRVSGSEPFRFSPDGRWFGYCARPEQSMENEIYIRPVQKGPSVRITQSQRVIQGWTWTPDGRDLIFSSNINGPFALWRIRAEAGNHAELVAGTGQDARFPEMSSYAASRLAKSVTLLVYERWQRVLNLQRREIALDRKTGLRHALPAEPLFPSTRDDNSPQISPDGRSLVFISNRSGFDEIWRGDLAQLDDPEVLTTLGSSGLYPHSPHWSPDGSRIVFSATTTSQRTMSGFDIAQIYVVPAQGGRMRPVTAWNSEQSHPVWSNDGRWIYFASNRSGTFEIWKIPADAPDATHARDNGTLAVQVTRHGGAEVQVAADGQTLYLKNDGFGDGSLWALAAGTDSPKQVSDATSREWWSVTRDGIYYVDVSRSATTAYPAVAPKSIYFLNARTRQVTEVGDIRERFFSFRPDFCASPDGRQIVYSQFVNKNIDLMLVRDFH
ncbi:hypothetical protein DYQ86_24970 [Acidobacteria bacterium AB60]|nr:hypothetical protein DYQ86_24970 [Acidobacteria bacterium AB60]